MARKCCRFLYHIPRVFPFFEMNKISLRYEIGLITLPFFNENRSAFTGPCAILCTHVNFEVCVDLCENRICAWVLARRPSADPRPNGSVVMTLMRVTSSRTMEPPVLKLLYPGPLPEACPWQRGARVSRPAYCRGSNAGTSSRSWSRRPHTPGSS